MSLHQASVDPGLFNRAMAWLDAPWARQLDECMTAKTGRPRAHAVTTILGLLAIAAMETPGELLLTRAARVTERLSPPQMHRLGLESPETVTGKYVSRTVKGIECALTGTFDPDSGEMLTPPRFETGVDDFLTTIVVSVVPSTLPASRVQSIDSTDLEAHARRRSRGARADVAADSLPNEDFRPGEKESNHRGFPKVGGDGRMQHTVDPDAREGYRAGKNGARKGTFVGWDAHFTVDTAAEGDPYRPPLIRAMSIAPAGSSKATAGLAAIDAARRCGTVIEQLLADRAYSYLRQENWAYALADREIEPVIDLHTTQRGVRPGPAPGLIYLDGGLFTSALPTRLRHLKVASLSMSSAEKDALARQYDERATYAYLPMGRPNFQARTQRYRGPALRGVLRCPNVPASLRLRSDRNPTTSCEPGAVCGCGRTITLGPDDAFQTRQRHLWGTTKWRASYGRRNAVETANALVHTHYGRLVRGSIRVRGTVKNGLLAAIIISTVNIALLSAVYGYDIGNPPPPGTLLVVRLNVTHARHRKPRVFRRPKRPTRT